MKKSVCNSVGHCHDVRLRRNVLDDCPGFAQDLAVNGLLSLKDIDAYLSARQAEAERRDLDAIELYGELVVFDSVLRKIDLTERAYPELYKEAANAFEAGDYDRATRLFERLRDYSDSAARAERTRAIIPTPSPTPKPEIYVFKNTVIEQAVQEQLGKASLKLNVLHLPNSVTNVSPLRGKTFSSYIGPEIK